MAVPDYSDSRPVKVQIADHLREQIASGALQPGAKLPSLREMARQYHVVTGTVRDAIDILRREELLQTRSTQGTFVLKPRGERPPSEYEAVMGRIDQLSEEVRQLREEVAEVKRVAAR